MEKACTKCGEVKPLDGFAVESRNKSGRAAHCKECELARQKEYYADNRDERLAYKKKYREENRDDVAASNKKYREENPEKIKAGQKKYREKNLDKKVAGNAKRRAVKLERIPSWSNEADLKAIKKVYENCRLMSILTGIPHEVDHVIPMQGDGISGLHHSTNLAIIPASLNASKSNKWEFSEVNYG